MSSRKNHRAVRKNPETGVRIKLDFASSLPRKLEEWTASNRIEYDKCDFHIEELEDEFHEEEKWWWTTTNGHQNEKTMDALSSVPRI